jgi:hypothetical protein
MKMPGGSHRPGTSRAGATGAASPAYLLLLREDLPPELELALRLPERLPPLALARSLWARLFWVLALPPLLAACARLDFPEEDEDLEEPEDEELRDAIACSFGWMHQRPHMTSGGHLLTLGRPCADPVGLASGSA